MTRQVENRNFCKWLPIERMEYSTCQLTKKSYTRGVVLRYRWKMPISKKFISFSQSNQRKIFHSIHCKMKERITVENLQCEYKRVNEFESKKQVCFKHDWK